MWDVMLQVLCVLLKELCEFGCLMVLKIWEWEFVDIVDELDGIGREGIKWEDM